MAVTILRMWCAHHAEKALWSSAATAFVLAIGGFVTRHGYLGAGGLAAAGALAAAAIIADRSALNRQILADIRTELRRDRFAGESGR